MRWDIGGVLGAVGAGGGCSAADALIHAVVQQIELGLEEGKRGGGKKENTSQFETWNLTTVLRSGCPVTASLKGQCGSPVEHPYGSLRALDRSPLVQGVTSISLNHPLPPTPSSWEAARS